MSKEAALAVIKLSPPVAWLAAEVNGVWSWLGLVNWGVLTGAATFVYTVLMIVHLLRHWDEKRDAPDESIK